MRGDPRGVSALDRLRELARRRKWPALLVFSFVASCALAVVAGLPEVYRATATILVEPPKGLEVATPEEVEARLHLITEEIQSRSRLLELIEQFHLYASLKSRASEEEVLRQMRRDIRLDMKGPQSGTRAVTAFTLSFLGSDSDTVSQVANALAARYVEEDQKMRSGNVDVLGSQFAEAKKRLEEEEQRLGEFREKHPGELPEQSEANMSGLLRIDGQLRTLSETRMRALDKRATLAKQLADEASAGPSGGDPQERLARLRQQLAEMRRTYTDKYPDVVRLQDEIRTVEQQVAEAPKEPRGEAQQVRSSTADTLREVDAEIRGIKEDEQRLRAEAQQYHARIEAAPSRGRAYGEMSRDYETTKTLYNLLLKRYEEAQLTTPEAAGRGGQRLRLLEPAFPPKAPAAPNRPQLAVLGLVLALALSTGVVVVAEQANSSFHSVEDLRTFTRVPVLATIPRITGPRGASRRWRLQALIATASLLSLILAANASYRFARGNDALVSLVTRAR